MMRNSSIGKFILFILLGLVFGAILGEALGWLFGYIGVISGGEMNNPIRNFFVYPVSFSFGIDDNGMLLDLYFLKLRLGAGVRLNVCSILGVAISLYYMRWSSR